VDAGCVSNDRSCECACVKAARRERRVAACAVVAENVDGIVFVARAAAG